MLTLLHAELLVSLEQGYHHVARSYALADPQFACIVDEYNILPSQRLWTNSGNPLLLLHDLHWPVRQLRRPLRETNDLQRDSSVICQI